MVPSYAWPGVAVAGASGRTRGLALLFNLAAVPVVALVTLPLLGLPAVLLLSGVQLLISLLQWAWPAASERLPSFALSQLVHLLGLAVVWMLLSRSWLPTMGTSAVPLLPQIPTALWLKSALGLGVLGLTLRGGLVITALTLRLFPSLPLDPATARMGRTVGILERALVMLLVALGQWSATAVVIAAKSLARFEALKDKHFAEYYLIGTLTSLLVASVGGLLLHAILQRAF